MSVKDNDNIPFTFVEVEESMYNMTVDRIKQLNAQVAELNKESEDLLVVVESLKNEISGLESILDVIERDLVKTEEYCNILVDELLVWRNQATQLVKDNFMSKQFYDSAVKNVNERDIIARIKERTDA
jgi:hypothetical protein